MIWQLLTTVLKEGWEGRLDQAQVRRPARINLSFTLSGEKHGMFDRFA